MGIVRFSLQNLRRNPKDAAFFAFSIIMTTAVIMVFFCIISNPYFGAGNGMVGTYSYSDYDQSIQMIVSMDQGVGSGIFTTMLSILIIAICITTIFFSNNFFLLTKTKDLGIMMMSGCNLVKVGKFLIVQNFAVILLTAPLGGILGLCISPLLNYIIYSAMNIQAPIFAFNWIALGETVFTVFMVCVWLVILDSGFVYRCDSLDALLKARKQMKARKHQNMFLRCVYTLVYVLSLFFIYTYPLKQVTFIYMIYIGVFIYFGISNLYRYVLPEVISWIQKKFFSANKHWLLSLGNLQYSVVGSNTLVTIILLSTTVLVYYLCKFRHDKATFAVVLFSYVVVLFLVSICLIYKLAMDAMSKEVIFTRLRCIGYLEADIKKIIHQEVFGFYGLLVLLSIPQIIIITSNYAKADIITMPFAGILLVLFIISVSIAALFTNHVYQKIILQASLTQQLEQE